MGGHRLREVLYLTFRSIAAATDAFRLFKTQEGWNAAFAPPRVASSRLWCGNVPRETCRQRAPES